MLFAITGLPILLTGAALVGVPVLLHLIMKQEPKRLLFPAFRFLKQKQRINQRKIRLRHLLLLLLRIGLIALICLSLFQPKIVSKGFNLRGSQPAAIVIVIDTSASMGYVLSERTGLTEQRQNQLKMLEEPADGPWTCLDEARGRALELLDDVPAGSKVAVIDSADRVEPTWSNTVEDARDRIRAIKRTTANSRTISQSLESAYLFYSKTSLKADSQTENLPRLLAVFSDTTRSAWDNEQKQTLLDLKAKAKQPDIFHLWIDVGVEKPVNCQISSFHMQPQLLSTNQPAVIDVVLQSTGQPVNNIVKFVVDGNELQRLPITLDAGGSTTLSFVARDLPPGLHEAGVSLVTSDALNSDNERFISFRVREARKILVLIDDPVHQLLTGSLAVGDVRRAQAFAWITALESLGWYQAEVATTAEFATGNVNLASYELVTLMALDAPTDELWRNLNGYLNNGGQVILVPGNSTMNPINYRTDAAMEVLAARYDFWEQIAVDQPAISWAWAAMSPQRPMLTLFRKVKETSDFFDNLPPATRGYWKLNAPNPDRVIVTYNDAAMPDLRSPAILERTIGPRGTLIQFTTPMGIGSDAPHNYATSWFYLVLVNETVSSMLGDQQDRSFNFYGGQNVLLPWPTDGTDQAYYLSGPGVDTTAAVFRKSSSDPYFRLSPDRTGYQGHFRVESEDRKFREGFSINIPPNETNLERLESGLITEIMGEESLVSADRELSLDDSLRGKVSQPIELFPLLMIALLLFLAFENFLSNRFYRKRTAEGGGK
ncbi:MAG: BatA domain-containing protein [Zavarzinella sp.]